MTIICTIRLRPVCLGRILTTVGCSGASSSDGANSSLGGSPQSGGAAAGGAATGGDATVGGQLGTGGAPSAGGSPATGGQSVTGGAAATGGTLASPTGGKSATGGMAPTGGRGPTGGATAAGGTAALPTGGKSTAGGMAPTGGSRAAGGGTTAATSGGAAATQGCGLSSVPPACSTAGSPCSMDVSGTARTYYVYLPTNYSASQKYPLVFQFHPMGGTAEQAINMPSIRSSFPAIYVTPQGLVSNGNAGWANSNGQDIAFTKQMVSAVESSYCVDTARVFSTGFSYGGMMSFAVGCEMSNVFRAIAPMSGALYSDFNCKGTGPAVAMWGSHGLSDNVVPIADGRSARDKILQQNHCGTTSAATTPSPCMIYDGCDSGYPATWCEFDGTHQIPSFANSAIAAFFKQF